MSHHSLVDFNPDTEVACTFCQKVQLATNHRCQVCNKELPRERLKLKSQTSEVLLPAAIGWTVGILVVTLALPAGLVFLNIQHGKELPWIPMYYWIAYFGMGFIGDLLFNIDELSAGPPDVSTAALENSGHDMKYESYDKLRMLIWPVNKIRVSWTAFFRSLD